MQLRKKIKLIFITLSISLVFISSLFFIVEAGSLTPPAPFATTMHSLQEIYDILAGDVVAFTGSGTDDMSIGGFFTGGTTLSYRIQIDAIGTPDTFTWSDDGGSTWDATGVAISGAAQALNNGVTITFATTTGHILGDRWDFVTQSSDVNGNIVQQLKYVSQNIAGATTTLQLAYDNSVSPPTITDSSNVAILTIQQTGTGNIIDFQNGAGSVFSVDNAGNIIMGASTLTAVDSVQISSGGTSNLVLNAGSGEIRAAVGSTFYNENGYAIAPSGEEILRTSIPIFGYDFPARTATAAIISREITLDANSFSSVPAGVNRVYKFKIQYANDLAAGDSSWQIINVTDPLDVYVPFVVPNTTIANLDESNIHYTAAVITLPAIGDQWHLQLTALAGVTVQVYQIELLAYDVLQ